MTEARRDRPFLRQAAICAGLFLAVLAAYGPALRAGLIWNDADYLTRPALRSLQGLGRIWFQLGATEQYYPVLHSAFWLEHRLWGDAPFGYHLVNVLLHATAACLFGLVLSRLATDKVAADVRAAAVWPWFAAYLFALHPVCVESVAWISEQKNTLSTVFYLLAALVYLSFEESRMGRGALSPARSPAAPSNSAVGSPRSTYLLATFLFLLAILSKSVTATLPAALLVALWWRNGRLSWKRDVIPLIPWFGAAAAMGLLSAWVERTYIGAQGTHFALTAPQRFEIAGHAFWFYLGKLVWPAHLVFIYPRWSLDPTGAAVWLYPLSVAAAGVGLAFLARRRRGPLAAFLFYLGSLFPTLGFFNVYAFVFSYVADHWQYLASLGVFALCGWSTLSPARSHTAEPSKRAGDSAFHLGIDRARGILGVSVLIVLGLLTWRQCRMYRDVETLYRVTIERNPGSWMAHSNLGTLLAAARRDGEAAAQFRTASRLAPEYPEIHVNLADALVRIGRREEAIREYAEAIRLGPGYAPAQVNLANTLVLASRDEEAIPHYRAALALLPGNPDLELGLGSALNRVGRPAEAAVHEAEALRLRPNFSEAEYELATTLANGGRLEQAIMHYRAAVRLRPDYAAARANLGLALVTAGRPGEALPELETALHLRPGYAEAHAYLGLALARLGRLRQAAAEYRAALRLTPGAADVHYQLALVLRSLGKVPEAAAEFEAAEHPSAP